MQDALTWPAAEQRALAERHRARYGLPARRTLREQVRLVMLRLMAPRVASRTASARPPGRVLVIRPDHLGDVLFATPALHQLRLAWPHTHITALVGPWSEVLLQHNHDVDAVLTFPFPGFTRAPAPRPWTPYRHLFEQARVLRALHFDLAIILRFDHWWGAWLAAMSGIPQRIGYATAECRPFLSGSPPYVAGRHEVMQNLSLVEAATGRAAEPSPALHFSVPAAAAAWAERFLAECCTDQTRLVALAPGTGAAVKLWRAEAWAGLAGRLQQGGCQVLLTGGRDERPLARAIGGLAGVPLVDLTGQTTLHQLAALFQHCSLVVGLDSGPMHLAVAVGTHTIQLYGPVASATFGPWGDPARHQVLTSQWSCIPCNRLDFAQADVALHPCVRAISLDDVMTALRRTPGSS